MYHQHQKKQQINSQKKTHRKDIAFYEIEVYDNYYKEKWILYYLHKTLTKLYPNIQPIPRKTLFKIKNSDALENRKKHSKRKDIESNESFKNFFRNQSTFSRFNI